MRLGNGQGNTLWGTGFSANMTNKGVGPRVGLDHQQLDCAAGLMHPRKRAQLVISRSPGQWSIIPHLHPELSGVQSPEDAEGGVA